MASIGTDNFRQQIIDINMLIQYVTNNQDDKFMERISSINENEIDLNIRNENGNYILFLIVMMNKKNLLIEILKKNINLDTIDQDGRSIMYYPIKFNYMDIIDILIEIDKKKVGISLINIRDYRGNTPIIYAIKLMNMDALKILLNNGADPNIRNNNGYNGLHTGVKYGNIEIVKLLIKNISNINIRTKENGYTALHYACEMSKTDVVKILIESGADQNVHEYENNYYPIFFSVINNNYDMTKILIDTGFNPNTEDIYGNTILHHAIHMGHVSIIEYIFNTYKISKKNAFLNNENITESDNVRNINPNVSNIKGHTILHMFIDFYIPEYKKYIALIIPYSNLNIQDNLGNTPIHSMIEKNILGLFKDTFRGKRIHVHIKNKNDLTVLDIIDKNDADWFIDTITENYYNKLKKYPGEWVHDFDNDCSKKMDNATCLKTIKEIILKGHASVPIRKNIDKITIEQTEKIEFSTFTGYKIDLIAGTKYITEKYPFCTSAYHKIKNATPQLIKHYESINIEERPRQFMIQFEIIWSFQKIFTPPSFELIISDIINSKKYDFIIVPIGIILSNGHHSNIILFDIKHNALERFEPHGSGYPLEFNYNPELLDTYLNNIFKSIMMLTYNNDNQLKYVSPAMYMPKIGFQAFDSSEVRHDKNVGDPKGFCTLWCLWYVDYRMKYINEPRDKLIFKLINEIKMSNTTFRSIIRNYSKKITDFRDAYLSKIGKNINDYKNDRITESEMDTLIDLLIN